MVNKIPIMSAIARLIHPKRGNPRKVFAGSKNYWIDRYDAGETSGDGSKGRFAEFKAEIINDFVFQHRVQTIIEYGCGDGNQLKLSKYPSYTGFDVSLKAVSTCREMFAGDDSKVFRMMDDYNNETAELTLSLDVIYHLVEDDVFVDHMNRLFDSATRYVIILSYDDDDNPENMAAHVRHRKFSRWVRDRKPEWRLIRHVPNRYSQKDGTKTVLYPDFFIYEKTA